ncbi:hypothetical protein LEP1GSC170_3944 [Leptospira interrogans serovar Bataviae str. HAI135]|nr:hypothetical protein LEP1GSC170_3944 [Leptospira interrogans serovar Bataviae str. HAI135]
MRQIHLLTETELKQRFNREVLESLFENSHPSALKEFSIQLEVWAQEKNAKYWIEFPDSIFDKVQLEKSEKTFFVLSLDLEKPPLSFHLKFFRPTFGENHFIFHLFRTNLQ